MGKRAYPPIARSLSMDILKMSGRYDPSPEVLDPRIRAALDSFLRNPRKTYTYQSAESDFYSTHWTEEYRRLCEWMGIQLAKRPD